jgi:hypothetical protein
MPLALELAASWTRVLPLRTLAEELEATLGLLGQRLEEVFERSWSLMTPMERQAFSRLGVFRGGFTREAAAAVAGIALPLLAALVDKSMLRTAPDGRFGLHMVLAEQARARFDALPEREGLAERHSRWYLGRHAGAVGLSAADHENLLAAWRHAVARGDLAAVEVALAELPWGFIVEGRLAQGVALFDEAARRLGGDSPTGAYLRAHQAWMLLWLGFYDDAHALAQSAHAVLPRAGHVQGTVMARATANGQKVASVPA